MPFQCDRCGHCCRTHRVPITVADIRRLAESSYVDDIHECVEWLDSESIDFDDEPESFFELREGRRVAFLRHVPANTCAPTVRGDLPRSQCVLLSDHGCQAFSARPSACRSYPYDRPSVDQGKLRLTLAPVLQCPPATDVFVTLGADPLTDATAQQFAQHIEQREQELVAHVAWVAHHNRLMRVLTRLGKARLTGAQTLQRMLDHGGDTKPAT